MERHPTTAKHSGSRAAGQQDALHRSPRTILHTPLPARPPYHPECTPRRCLASGRACGAAGRTQGPAARGCSGPAGGRTCRVGSSRQWLQAETSQAWAREGGQAREGGRAGSGEGKVKGEGGQSRRSGRVREKGRQRKAGGIGSLEGEMLGEARQQCGRHSTRARGCSSAAVLGDMVASSMQAAARAGRLLPQPQPSTTALSCSPGIAVNKAQQCSWKWHTHLAGQYSSTGILTCTPATGCLPAYLPAHLPAHLCPHSPETEPPLKGRCRVASS